jgi:hypothetical protein
MRRLVVVLASAVLAAGAVRAGTVEVDFNPKAEFERYKTWAFAPGKDENRHGVLADPIMRDRIEKSLAVSLEDAGLRPAGPDETPDVLVRYGGDTGTGKTVTMSEGVDPYNTIAPMYKTVRFSEQVATLIVDLIENSTHSLAWRLYVNEKFGGPYDKPGKLQRAVDKGFSKYPPSASERAKKARKIEKESGAK